MAAVVAMAARGSNDYGVGAGGSGTVVTVATCVSGNRAESTHRKVLAAATTLVTRHRASAVESIEAK